MKVRFGHICAGIVSLVASGCRLPAYQQLTFGPGNDTEAV